MPRKYNDLVIFQGIQWRILSWKKIGKKIFYDLATVKNNQTVIRERIPASKIRGKQP